jgi:hypothetical protein
MTIEPLVSKNEQDHNVYEAIAGNLIKTYNENHIPRFELAALEEELARLGDTETEESSALFVQRRE